METPLQRTCVGQKYPHIRTLRISVQSEIRVRKHNGNIHSNITVQLHCYHRMWSNITWILHHQETLNMKYNKIYKDEQYKRAFTSYNRKIREPNREPGKKDFGWSTDNPCFHCATIISNRENPQTPNSEFWTCRSRVIRSNPISTKMRPWGVYRQAHVYMVKWCDSNI